MNLQRENKIPTKARFDFVTEKAYDFLLEYGYNSFPISPFKVLEDLSDYVVCLPWSKAKNILKTTDPFHLREIKAEARTIRLRNDGLFYIVYDDVEVNNNSRIAWTIMHEIGHIILGHLTDFGETALDRGGLTREKYRVLEIEAHYFAAEFLMPTALMKTYSNIAIEKIELIFGVSETAAKKKHKRVFDTSYMPSSAYDELLARNFHSFLQNDVEGTIYNNIYGDWEDARKIKRIPFCVKCPVCYTYIFDRSAVYCPQCGSEIDKKKGYSKKFESWNEDHKLVKLPGFSHPSLPHNEVELADGTKVQRVKFCPNCLSHDISSNSIFCKICGNPLSNSCSSCGRPLKVNERFCPACSAESAFCELYATAEKRLNSIKDCSAQPQFSEDWFAYPYWDYVKARLSSNNQKVNGDLETALLYSMAYINDDETFIVYADSLPAVEAIYDNQQVILDFVKKADKVEYTHLEVYLFQ